MRYHWWEIALWSGAGLAIGAFLKSGVTEYPEGTGEAKPFELGKLSGWRGEDITLYAPSGGLRPIPLPGFMALVPIDQVIASHDPVTFDPDPRFPPELQERDYKYDRTEQQKVIQATANFLAEFVVAPSPTAIDGPPVIDEDGLVLGGNSRAMVLKRIHKRDKGAWKVYQKALQNESACYGLGGVLGGITGKRGLMLVRVVVPSELNRQEISRALNRPFTQQLSTLEEASSLGRLITTRALELVGEDPEKTLLQNIRSNNEDIVQELVKAGIITPQERAGWLEKKGMDYAPRLSKQGQARLANAIMGAAVEDPSLLALTPRPYVQLYEQIAPTLLALERLEPTPEGFALLDAFQIAIKDVHRIRSMPAEKVAEQLGQETVFADTWEVMKPDWIIPAQLLTWLWKNHRTISSRTEAGRAMRKYGGMARSASSGMGGLFGDTGPTPLEARTEALSLLEPEKGEDAEAYLKRYFGGGRS